MRVLGYSLLVAALGVPVAAIATHLPAARRIITLATTHQPERFTELYFNAPQTLPTSVSINTKYEFSYTVANHEAAARTYRFETYYLVNGQKHVLSQGTIALSAGQSSSFALSFVATQVSQAYQVGVSLPDLSQDIVLKVAS